METPSSSPNGSHAGPGLLGAAGPAPQLAILDFFFPGFSGISSVVLRYLGIDLNVYIPLLVLFAGLMFAWDYVRNYTWAMVTNHFMSTVEIRVDDEIHNIVMGWIANQSFARTARRFIVNVDLSSRMWDAWRDHDDDYDSDDEDASSDRGKKPLSYTPSFGTHIFWYKGRPLMFQRTQNRDQVSYMVSEREEVSISCFGRSPWVLKQLLLEARLAYMKKDENNTLIYRGTCRGVGSDPTWQRCLSRPSRPLSTVVLSEAKKKRLLEDVADYLNPATRRWYSNRGIPYRRGYLLYGPPGTGKSSLSLALAGYFKMRIYIVSLNSISSSEENLSSLFADLPRRCVVLLEDIDTAGLTNTREAPAPPVETAEKEESKPPGAPDKTEKPSDPLGRLSLSGLLNILDGVASQEGRLLIMTTNHLENLDSALIRPGRVDMTIEFSRADGDIAASIFSAIYTKMEGDEVDGPDPDRKLRGGKSELDQDEVEALAREFAAEVPGDEFSPAELQGYLLRHKRSPRDAVANIGPWVMEMRRQKKEKGVAQAEQVTFVERKDEPAADQAEESGGPGLGSDTPSSGDSVVSEPRTPADVGLPPADTKGEERDGGAVVVDN